MSFKRPFSQLSIDELDQKLRRLVYHFEQGEEITNERLDMYLLLTKRIKQLETQTRSSLFGYRNMISSHPNSLFWVPYFRKHVQYGNIRFKITTEGYPPFDFDLDLVIVVNKYEFERYEPGRLALFIGSRAGIIPKFDRFPGLSESPRKIAILSTALQSGNVLGLGIYRMSYDEMKSEYVLEKKIYFGNKKTT
jgi:hypothetical protein